MELQRNLTYRDAETKQMKEIENVFLTLDYLIGNSTLYGYNKNIRFLGDTYVCLQKGDFIYGGYFEENKFIINSYGILNSEDHKVLYATLYSDSGFDVTIMGDETYQMTISYNNSWLATVQVETLPPAVDNKIVIEENSNSITLELDEDGKIINVYLNE